MENWGLFTLVFVFCILPLCGTGEPADIRRGCLVQCIMHEERGRRYSMLVTMKRQEFEAFDDAALARACIEPTIERLHGSGLAMRSERPAILAQLTDGQRALFLFRVMYDHAGNSAPDLYCWASGALKEGRTWAGIKGGLRFFRSDAMLELLGEIEVVLEARDRQGDALPWDLDDDAELFALMNGLNDRFQEIAAKTLKLIGQYIRTIRA